MIMKPYYLLQKCANYSGRPVRLLGISLNNTINKKNYKEQLNIFEMAQEDETNDDSLEQLLNAINNKFDKKLVTKASSFAKKTPQKKYLK